MSAIVESRAQEMLRLEEADAWFVYLERTREETGVRYRVVENEEWDKLAEKLQKVEERRSRLRPWDA